MATVSAVSRARMLAIEAASVVNGTIDAGGNLILTKHDQSTIDAGQVVGPQGISVVDADVDGSGNLILTLEGGATINAGLVKGTNGTNGTDGADAAPGSVIVLGDTTPIRTSDGRIKAEDPTEDDDVATKLWVNNQRAGDGVWQSYSASLLSTVTNPTMGNSTITGRYTQRGKTVSVNVDILFGSTFSPGSGLYRITLPVTPTAAYHQSLSILFTAAGDFQGHARLEGSSGNQRLQFHRNGYDNMSAMGTAFYTPVNGNRITMWGTYEAA